MKLKNQYPNFNDALLFYIKSKNPVLASDDSKLLSYFLGLKSFKKAFDYYELVPFESGGVYFRIVTTLGIKTIAETRSEIYKADLSNSDWSSLIYKMTITHFQKEEYIALLKGYVKKNEKGCFGVVLLLMIVSILFYF